MRLIDCPGLVFLVLFVVFGVALEIGFRVAAMKNANEDPDLHEQAVGVVVLLSVLLSFALAMALPRFDRRREFTVNEANAIGSTALRAQMLPEPSRTISHEPACPPKCWIQFASPFHDVDGGGAVFSVAGID